MVKQHGLEKKGACREGAPVAPTTATHAKCQYHCH